MAVTFGLAIRPSVMIHADLGTGPAVLFIHGCPTPPDVMRPLAEAVAGHRRALVVALPGYGGTPLLDGAFEPARIHAAIEESLAARGIEEVDLVGYSGGAWHALSLALRGRVRVGTVVSLAGRAGLDPPVREAFRSFAAQVAAGGNLGDVLVAACLPSAFAAKHPEVVREVHAWGLASPPEALARELEAVVGYEDLRPRLGELTCHLACRAGQLDLAVPAAEAMDMVTRAPRSNLELVPGVGHALMHEDLDGTVRFVRRALRIS